MAGVGVGEGGAGAGEGGVEMDGLLSLLPVGTAEFPLQATSMSASTMISTFTGILFILFPPAFILFPPALIV